MTIFAFYVRPHEAYRSWRLVAAGQDRAWVEAYAAKHYPGWIKKIEEMKS